VRVELDEIEREVFATVQELAARRVPLTVEDDRPHRAFYEEVGELGFFDPELPLLTAGLVACAFGRELVPGPWLEHTVALRAAARHADGVDLDDFVAGRRLLGEALTGGSQAAADVDLWLVADGDGALLVTETPPGEPAETVDPGWRGVAVDGAPADGAQVGELDAEASAAVAAEAGGLAAAAAVGSSGRLIELTVDYVRQREQFGRPIGSFQAVKHALADAYADVQHTRSLVLASLASEGNERARLLPLAKLAADGTYRRTAETALQLHGGIGFTWECPVHLFLKNALRLATYPAPPSAQRALVARHLRLVSEPEEVTP
jgi:alkylation response protein AidB-like acyl-CoA dehydrogenase